MVVHADAVVGAEDDDNLMVIKISGGDAGVEEQMKTEELLRGASEMEGRENNGEGAGNKNKERPLGFIIYFCFHFFSARLGVTVRLSCSLC